MYGSKKSLAAFALTLVAAFAMTGGTPVSAQEQATQRPNIVFILADDMRADDLKYMPQTRQRIAEQGITFPNAFVSFSLCCPSRASILRGQYAHNHHVLDDDPPEGGFDKFQNSGDEKSTIATWLNDDGYRTVLLGKYLNHYGDGNSETYVPPGWDEWYAKLGAGYYDYQLNENGKIVSYGHTEEDYYTDVLAQEAEAYVRRAADDPTPFFMYLAPATPHQPFKPAPRHRGAFAHVKAPRPPSFDEADVSDKPTWVQNLPRLGAAGAEEIDDAYRKRLRMLLSLDDMVAGLIDKLKATGKLDNTYLFFTSDNGYQLGEHRISMTKRTEYEESLRVPLVVRGPGVPSGATADGMALNIDFAPTFAELAGTSVPAFVDGRSLVPLLSGSAPTSWRTAFLIENWRRVLPRAAATFAGVRTENHKYVEQDPDQKELYDLSADPYELENRYETADPAVVESLKSRLEALRTCAGESCRSAEDKP